MLNAFLDTPDFSIDTFIAETDDLIVFGAGGAGRHAIRYLRSRGKRIRFVCDNDPDKQGTQLDGVAIKAPESLVDMPDAVVLIASDYAVDIAAQLRTFGCSRAYYFGYCFDYDQWKNHFDTRPLKASVGRIQEAYSLFEDEHSRDVFRGLIQMRATLSPGGVKKSPFPEYFHPKVSPQKGDTIVDGGAWNGDTAEEFVKALDGQCRIYSFEPDAGNYKALEERIARYPWGKSVVPVASGLWSESGTLKFKSSSENSMQFQIVDDGDSQISVVSIDEFFREKNEAVQLVKMDIEGAEMEALKGCRQMIVDERPALQICIYHKEDDLWEIPLFVKSLVPEYRLYLGHHSQNIFETILYAKCE